MGPGQTGGDAGKKRDHRNAILGLVIFQFIFSTATASADLAEAVVYVSQVGDGSKG